MKILTRYLYKELFKFLFIFETAFISLYLIIDFLQKIDNFIETKSSKDIILSYFLYKIPFIFVQMIPASMLLSVIILFYLMKKDNEITALKASGVSVFSTAKPVIAVSLILGAGVFLCSEILVPHTSTKSNEIWKIKVEKWERDRFYGSEEIWYKGKNAIYWIGYFNTEQKVMRDINFYFFNDSFDLTRRIDGDRAYWRGNICIIEDGVIYDMRRDGDYHFERFNQYSIEIPETQETFLRTKKKSEEMSYWELKKYAKRVKEEGYDNARYLVDLNIKTSFPFISFILTVIGIAISLGLHKGGTPLAVSVGMGVCFLYILTIGYSRSLGISGILPPLLSAWIPNLVYIFLGIYLMMHVET